MDILINKILYISYQAGTGLEHRTVGSEGERSPHSTNMADMHFYVHAINIVLILNQPHPFNRCSKIPKMASFIIGGIKHRIVKT